jgi:CPA2 family monovalent cation:H+ antiporter-2
MFSSLELTLLLLGCAVLGVVAFRMLQLPPMLGYLVVGILIGPHAFGLAVQSEESTTLAEFGVVFLMFSIGLEFSLPKLMAMRRIVFGLGLAQVVTTIVATMVFGAMIATLLPASFQVGWQASFALGGALAMSSTAIVSKMLTERLELESAHGRKIIGILLFQDLAVVPLLIMIPAMGQSPHDLLQSLAWAGAKAAIVLVLLLFLGQKLVRFWFAIVVKRRSQELFMLNLLLITLGAAWITERAGLSLALGAFVAGMLISETQYKHQVEEDIKPFRDVLLGLFFITIGMLLNLHVVFQNWWLVLLLLIVPVLFKFALIALLARLFGSSTGVSIRTGLALAQAGEFGFVLINLAGGMQLVNPLIIQVVLASMVLSMLVAPFLIAKSDQIVLKVAANEWMMQSLALTKIASRSMASSKHVILAGFGRNGQSLATLLSEEKIDYHALDLDPERVQEAQAAGANVSYGDAARRESLIAAGISRAGALVITYAETKSALKVLHLVHELAPTLPVIVRSYDDTDLDLLKQAGAAEVVPEALEGSLMLASHAMMILGVPLQRVAQRMQSARDQRYASLRGYFHAGNEDGDEDEQLSVRLHSVVLPDDASGVGKTLEQVNVAGSGAEVTRIRRGRTSLDVTPETLLQGGDVIVLLGTADAVEQAESLLLGSF